MKRIFLKAVKHSATWYAVWTGLGNVVEMLGLMLLVGMGMPRVVAYVPAFLASMVWNFLGSYHLVFSKTGRRIGESFGHYIVVSVGAFAVNQIFLALLEFELGLWYWGVLMTGPATFSWSYFWNKAFTFGDITPRKIWSLGIGTVVVCVMAVLVSVYYYNLEMNL